MSTILHKALRACLFAALCTLLAGVVSAGTAPSVKAASEGEWKLDVRVYTPVHDVCVRQVPKIGVATQLYWSPKDPDIQYDPPPMPGKGFASTHAQANIGTTNPMVWTSSLKGGTIYQDVTYTAPATEADERIVFWAGYPVGDSVIWSEYKRISFKVIHCMYSIKFDGTRTASGTVGKAGAGASVQKVNGEGHLEVYPETMSNTGEAPISGSGNFHYTAESASVTGQGGFAKQIVTAQGDGTFNVNGRLLLGDVRISVSLNPVKAMGSTGEACVGGKCISGSNAPSTRDMYSKSLQVVTFPGKGGTIKPPPTDIRVLGMTATDEYNITLTPED